MAPEFSREAILTGSVDQLCLACESYLRGTQEVLQHAGSAGHKENLAKTHYIDKYTHDKIRKVRNWYFCEPCNIVLTTRTKIVLHIEEPKHKENVEKNRIERVGDVIVSGNVVIQEEAWHGLINSNTCIICKEEFKNKDEHMSESNHIINLIQSNISYEGNNIYRTINEESLNIFHCLSCNSVVTGINAHFDDATHKNLLQISNNLKDSRLDANFDQQALVRKASPRSVNGTEGSDKIPNETLTCTGLNNELEKIIHVEDIADVKKSHENSAEEMDPPKSDVIDFIPKFQLESIDINFVSETVVCRKCSLKLELRVEVIENHIKEHSKVLKIKTGEIKPNLFENNESADSKALLTRPVFLNQENNGTEKFKTESTNTRMQEESDIGEYRNNKKINIRKTKSTLNEKNKNNKTTDSETLLTSPVIPNHEHKDTKNVETEPTRTAIKEESDINIETADSDTLLAGPAFPNRIHKDTENGETEPIKKSIPEDDESKYNAIQITAEDHGLNYTLRGNKVFCGICCKKVPSSVKSIKEHVKGGFHKNNATLSSRSTTPKGVEVAKKTPKKCNLQSVPTNVFIKIFTVVQNSFAQDVVVNGTYCINFLSFVFLKESSPGRLRCQVCEVNIAKQDIKQHIGFKKHDKVTTEATVLIHADSEFIREVSSGQFHCGYCNLIDTWEGMEEHLKSTLHSDSKTCANWRLTQYMPKIQEHIEVIDHRFKIDFLMRLFNNNNN